MLCCFDGSLAGVAGFGFTFLPSPAVIFVIRQQSKAGTAALIAVCAGGMIPQNGMPP
jgi:uncharacterized membrane protein YfcA